VIFRKRRKQQYSLLLYIYINIYIVVDMPKSCGKLELSTGFPQDFHRFFHRLFVLFSVSHSPPCGKLNFRNFTCGKTCGKTVENSIPKKFSTGFPQGFPQTFPQVLAKKWPFFHMLTIYYIMQILQRCTFFSLKLKK